MSHGRRWRLTAATAALALPAAAIASMSSAQAATGDRPVPGTRPAWAQATADRGAANAATTINARIWLAGQNPQGETDYATAVSDPHSALYRHYLTPAAFEARFGPTRSQQRAVESWARSQHLTVTGVTDHYVSVRASAASTQAAFSAKLRNYARNGTVVFGPDRDASVPAGIAPAVLTVTGLDDASRAVQPQDQLPPPPKNRWTPAPCSTYYGQKQATKLPKAYGRTAPWVGCGYTPKQFRKAYGVTGSGLTGKGVTVAVLDAYASPTMKSDANRYAVSHGDPAFRPGQYRQVLDTPFNQIAPTVCDAAGWYSEESMDVEAVHSMAPAANIVYVGAQNCNGGLDDALLKIVDQHLADVVSDSWAAPEDAFGQSGMQVDHQTFQQGAIEGIGFYFSSGDAGYETRRPPGVPPTAPTSSRSCIRRRTRGRLASAARRSRSARRATSSSRPAGVRTVTHWRPTRNPGPTSCRSYPNDWYGGSGGGTSTLFGQPYYQRHVTPAHLSQTLPTGAHSATPMRVVPDVSADADPYSGMAVGETVTMPDGHTQKYVETRWGGTSLACPLFAGIQALAQQAQHGQALGFANPAIYLRYGTRAYRDVTDTPLGAGHPMTFALNWYTDTANATGPILTYLATTGHNGEGLAALHATKGYDDETGVGSPTRAYLDSYR